MGRARWISKARKHIRRAQRFFHSRSFNRFYRQYGRYTTLVLLFVVGLVIAVEWANSPRTYGEDGWEAPSLGTSSWLAPLAQEPWSFFHPVWKKSDKWASLFSQSPDNNVKTPGQVEMEDFLSDPEHRLEREFKISSGMRERVKFWAEIYSKYSKRIKVVHDRNKPWIVYGHIDLRPVYRVLGNTPSAESKASDVERKVLKELRAKLAEASGIEKSNNLSLKERDEITEFLSQVGALATDDAQELVESVRSQTGQSEHFLAALTRSEQLLPHIEGVFRKKGLPVGLARIPFVESSFNARAQSKAGAVGIWQFTPETAREMIHPEEESYWTDPIKQTNSAVRLLQMYRSVLPDWGTTITSYNSGVGRVRRLVAKHRVRKIEQLLQIPLEEDLGFAGRNFYAEVLAANLVEAYKERIFSRMLSPIDASLVFRGLIPFPKNSCDF